MFNENIIEKLKSRLSEFHNIKLELKCQEFDSSNYYNLLNAAILYNTIIDEKPDNILMFHPTGESLLLNMLTVGAFAELERDVTNEDNVKERKLDRGDYVLLDGCLGRYKGREIVSGEQWHRFSFGRNRISSSTDIILSPKEMWRVYKYFGPSRELKGFRGRKHVPSNEVLSEILKISQQDINVPRISKIAIITDKKTFPDHLKTIKINSKIHFNKLFTVAKVTRENNYHLMGHRGTGIRKEPDIFLIQNLNKLYDFLNAGNKINLIIIDGLSRIKNNFDMIEHIKDYEYIENIILLMRHSAYQQKKDFESIGFKTWFWTNRDIVELGDMQNWRKKTIYIKSGERKNIFDVHSKVLNNLSKQKISFLKTVSPNERTLQLLERVEKSLKKIRFFEKDTVFYDREDFLFKAYGMIRFFRYVPFSISDFFDRYKTDEVTYYDPDNEIAALRYIGERLVRTFLPSEYEKKVNAIVEDLYKLKEHFVANNPKSDKLLEVLRESGGSIALVVGKKWYIYFLKKWFKENGIEDFDSISFYDFSQFTKIRNHFFFDKVIFTSWYGFKNGYFIHTGITDSLNWIIYPEEEKWAKFYFKGIEEDTFGLMDISTRAQLLEVDENDFDIREVSVIEKEEDVIKEGDLEEIINSISYRTVEVIGMDAGQGAGERESVEAKHIIFEEESHGFFTKRYKARVLNRSEETIESKDLDDIEENDEMIFIKDSRGDLFDELVIVARDSEGVKKDWEKAKIWQKVLRKHVEENSLSVEELTEKLSEQGCNREFITIRGWLMNDSIIGPREGIRAIAALTEDKELNSQLEEVLSACNRIHVLHIKLGKYLVKRILSSMRSDEDSEIEDFLKDRIDELSQHIMIVEVRSIGKETLSVPGAKTNRLLTIGE